MKHYRSLATHLAVQYTGEPIEGVTCEGTAAQRIVNGCENSRGHMPHAHTKSTGGLDVLTPGCWIMPVAGGPFYVVPDATFRSNFEVPAPAHVATLTDTITALEAFISSNPHPPAEQKPDLPWDVETGTIVAPEP